MSSENSELAILKLNYDIAKLKQFVYAAEQSEQEASEIIAELKAENKRLKEKNKQLEQTLQEIKAIAKGVRSYMEVPAPRDVRFEMDRILNLIAKVQESEQQC